VSKHQPNLREPLTPSAASDRSIGHRAQSRAPSLRPGWRPLRGSCHPRARHRPPHPPIARSPYRPIVLLDL